MRWEVLKGTNASHVHRDLHSNGGFELIMNLKYRIAKIAKNIFKRIMPAKDEAVIVAQSSFKTALSSRRKRRTVVISKSIYLAYELSFPFSHNGYSAKLWTSLLIFSRKYWRVQPDVNKPRFIFIRSQRKFISQDDKLMRKEHSGYNNGRFVNW